MFHHQRTPENQLVQFVPARAKVSIKEEEFTQLGNAYVEQKLDGQRFVIQTDRPVPNRYRHGCTSRRESVETLRMVEKTDRVPHIANAENLPHRSLIDTEFAAPTDAVSLELPGVIWDGLMDKDHPHMRPFLSSGAIEVFPHVSETTSIMGSNADLAIEKQNQRGLIRAWAFDIVQFMDRDVRGNPQAIRRALLAKSLINVDPQAVCLMPAWKLDYQRARLLYDLVCDVRGEGLMLKAATLPYNHAKAWAKLKKLFTADVVLTGHWKEGKEGVTGKMVGLAGTLEVGVYKDGILVPIGWVSAIMDSEANLQAITDACLDGSIAGTVMEVAFNDLQKDGVWYTLRHPRYRRYREDKNPEDCTIEALLELFREDKAR